MSLLNKWRNLSLFWQTYLVTVLLVGSIVASVELLEDVFLEPFILAMTGSPASWHEDALWAVGVLFPSLLSGYLLSWLLRRKLKGIENAVDLLARGDLSARAVTLGNTGDVFDRVIISFNVMAQRLEKLLTNERRLLTDISHELRSPLTRMNMAIALAQRTANEETLSHIARMEKEVERMNALVALLLQQGREALVPEGESVPVDVSDLLRDIAADAAFEGEVIGKQVDCAIDDNLVVYGSSLSLRTLFNNITANALAHTSSGSTMQIRGWREGKEAVVTVTDNGPGVPEDMLDDIFRAFYRVDDSRTRSTGGVGLGLAIARQAARMHGGDIEAQNRNPGLCMTVRLPLKEGDIFL